MDQQPIKLTHSHPAAFGDFWKKYTETHDALGRNLFGLVYITDRVKASKDAAVF